MKAMPQVNPQPLWDRILQIIKGNVNSQSFQTWLVPTKLTRVENNTLFIEAPNQFFTDWLSEHYMPMILAAAKEVMGGSPGVELVVKGCGAPEGEPRGKRKQTNPFFRRYTRSSKSKGLLLNENYTFSEFVVGNNSMMAHAASLAVAEKPGRVYNPLFIYGGSGLGKTHLAQAIAHFFMEEHSKAKVFYASSESFINELIYAIRQGNTMEFKNKYRSVDLLILDDIQFLEGKERTQEEFFHTFNALYDSQKQIVLTSDRPPKEIKTLEERLISRFEWGLITDIQAPDLETRLAILKKKIEKDSLAISDDVLYLIAENVTHNIRELEGSLIRLLAFAGLTGSKINIDLAREVLQDFIRERPRIPNIPDIQKSVSEKYSVSVELIKSEKRSSRIVFPRQVAVYLSRELTDKSLIEIGRQFGGRDHTTVMHACRKIEKCLKDDNELKMVIAELRQKFSMGR
jgi:chromosomal replication initiator protein